MKTTLTLAWLIILGLGTTVSNAQTDLLNDEFPEAQQEIIETFGGIVQSLKDGDMDKLISYHAYGPKFTEFKKGERRNGGAANEVFEREVFGKVTEVIKFDAKDLKLFQ